MGIIYIIISIALMLTTTESTLSVYNNETGSWEEISRTEETGYYEEPVYEVWIIETPFYKTFSDAIQGVYNEALAMVNAIAPYPNGTNRRINIHGSYGDCEAYFNRLGVKNRVISGGENDDWICFYNSKDIYLH